MSLSRTQANLGRVIIPTKRLAYRASEGATLSLQQGATFNFVKRVDKSAAGNNRDGFDINGIAVIAAIPKATPVPEPTRCLA